MKLTGDEQWTHVWKSLPYVDEKGNKYQYYVSETPMAGFTTGYDSQVYTLTVGTESVSAAIADGYERNRSVTVTNRTSFQLPETGGPGTERYIPLGLLLMAAALLYQLRDKKKRQRGRG